MNILLVSHDLLVSGAPNSLLRQAGYFKEAGHRVTVWTISDGPLRARYEEKGFHPLLIRDDKRHIQTYFEGLHVRPDFIICNTTETYRFVDVLQRYGIPIVWFIRETMVIHDKIRKNQDFARVFSAFPNLYTVSEYAAGVISAYNTSVRVIHNSFPDSFERYVQPTETPRFGFIGTILERKGIDLLVDAFGRFCESHPNAELHIAGNYETALGLRLVRKTSGNPRIRWWGELQLARKVDFFSTIDVLCVPSVDDPCPLTVFEGSMLGKVLITSDTVGSNFLVEEGVNGHIFSTGDESSLVASMEKIAHADRAAMGSESRRIYLEKGSPRLERERVLSLLTDVGAIPLEDIPPLRLERRPFFGKVNYVGGFRELYLFGIRIVGFYNPFRKYRSTEYLEKYKLYGARNFLQYRFFRFVNENTFMLPSLSVLWSRIRRKRYDQIVPLGIDCQVAFRFYCSWGFVDSSLFAWAYSWNLARMTDVLGRLDELFSAGGTIDYNSRMWVCNNTGLRFHGQLKLDADHQLTQDEVDGDLRDLCGRVAHLRDKLRDYLSNERRTLIIHRLSEEDAQAPDLAARIDGFEHALAQLGARNCEFLYVCERHCLENMPRAAHRQFRAVRIYNAKGHAADKNIGDAMGWRAIFTEFAPMRILPKKHTFKFE